MAEDDPWKRRREGFFGGFFPPEIEAEIERMRGEMERMMAEALKGGFPAGFPPQGAKPGQPFMYGFTMRMGPDGKPHIQQFGNTPNIRSTPEVGVEGAREPVTDVLEGDREVAITIELPGVEKPDVNLHVAEDAVTIRVDSGRKYYKRITLPSPVVPKTANATFKNGVLDVTVERAKPRTDPGYKVDIR